MNNYIKIYGKVLFDPEPLTSKHEKQGDWKRAAIIEINGDIHHYYRWLLCKRYNLNLMPPLRKAHVTFINDRTIDMNDKWEIVKEKWHGKKVEIYLDIENVDSDGLNWWLKVPYEHRSEIQSIRSELNLGEYKWGFHMTLGTAVNIYGKVESGVNATRALQMNEEHSRYIRNFIKNK